MGPLSIGFLVIAVVDFALLIWALRLYGKYPSTAQWLATAPLGLLWYDNIVIGIGGTLGEGDLLITLNTYRFLGHYVFLPFAFLAIASMAKQAGFKWAQPRIVVGAFAVLATYFILHDLYLFKNSNFYPSCFADTLRYTTRIAEYTACSADADIGAGAGIPPIPAMSLSSMMLVFGLYLWWKVGFKWLFLGSLGALVFFGIPYSRTGGIFSNIGEPIIMSMVLVTAAHITRHRDSWQTAIQAGGRVSSGGADGIAAEAKGT
jgi:hypothetical protein